MATVFVNDLTIEPKTPAARATSPAQERSSAAKPLPQLEREIETFRHRVHERALRSWAH